MTLQLDEVFSFFCNTTCVVFLGTFTVSVFSLLLEITLMFFKEARGGLIFDGGLEAVLSSFSYKRT